MIVDMPTHPDHIHKGRQVDIDEVDVIEYLLKRQTNNIIIVCVSF